MIGELSLSVPMFDGTASCTETDPEAFFPDQGGQSKAAKDTCRRCEVVEECLQWALDNEEVHWGIWGAKSPNERQRMLRERTRTSRLKPIRHGTESGYRAHKRRGEPVPPGDPCGCRAAERLAHAERMRRKAAA